jgi:hypothetical protein
LWCKILKGKDVLRDTGLEVRIVLKWIIKKLSGRGVDSVGFEYGQTAGSCEYGNESSWSNKGGEFLHHFRNCQLLRKDSVAWNESYKKKNCTRVQTIFVCNVCPSEDDSIHEEMK